MNYDLKIEDVSSIQRRLEFTLPSDVVRVELDKAFRDLGKNVRLPGFRRGKVPRQILESRFGQSVRAEVGSKLINQSWQEAIGELEVAGQPTLEDQGEVERNSTFWFRIAVEVKPTIEVNDYTGLEVEYVEQAVTGEQVDAEVERRLASQARIQEVTEDRGVEAGDLVLTELKLVGADGDELVDEPGTMITTAGDRYYPGVEAVLLGVKKDKSKKKKITIGDDSAIEELRGVEATAHIKVLGIQSHQIPELSDDLATELGYEGGTKGMRSALEANLQERLDENSRNQARANLLQILVDANDFEVPAAMIEEQLQMLTEELRIRRAYQGEDPRAIQFTDEEMADLNDRARFAAKASCILASIAASEKIEVESTELDAKIDEIATMRAQAPAAIRAALDREGALPVLETRILEEKAIEWLVEQSKLVPTKGDDKPAKKKATKKKAAAAEPAEQGGAPTEAELGKMKVADLKALAKERGVELPAKAKKADIVAAIVAG